MSLRPSTKASDNTPKTDTGVSAGRKSGARRGRSAVGGFKPGSQRNPRALAIAVVAHLAVAIILLRAITFDTGFRDYFGFGPDDQTAQETLTYVETREAEPPALPEREREPEPRVAEAPAAPAIDRGPVVGSAPAEVPSGPPRLIAPGRDSAAVNRLPAAEAAVVGVVPRADSRLWTVADLRALRDEVRAAALVASGGMEGARELDSVITWVIGSARDSLDSLAVIQGMGPRTANWTKKDGKGGTWGLDPSGIRLGKVTIPSALLALLPASAQRGIAGNPIAYERNKSLALAQSDIARFRNAGPGNDTFKMLVQELRERRDRERAARRAGTATAGPVVPVRGANGQGNGPP